MSTAGVLSAMPAILSLLAIGISVVALWYRRRAAVAAENSARAASESAKAAAKSSATAEEALAFAKQKAAEDKAQARKRRIDELVQMGMKTPEGAGGLRYLYDLEPSLTDSEIGEIVRRSFGARSRPPSVVEEQLKSVLNHASKQRESR